MPIRRPSRLTSAPPELPGLIAASVWMKKLESLTPPAERASAEMMPLVTVWFRPNGLPIASTTSPTSIESESRSSMNGNLSPWVSMRSRARS